MDNRLSQIFLRRSIRKFSDKPVSDADIRALLEAGMAAPSARATDPWRIIVVTNSGTLAKMAQALPNGKMLAECSVAFVVCGDMQAANDQLISYCLQDCSAAIENILIGAQMIGLGAVWLGIHPREERIAAVKELFPVPEPIMPISIIAIGYPAEQKEPRTRYNESFVHFEKW
jgi:nitroreductase